MGNVPIGRRPSWMKEIPKPVIQQETKVIKINGVELYKTNRHRNASARHRMKYPYCYTCQEQGITTLADMMDHVIPVNVGGDPWDRRNRMSMCHNCHNSKRGKEAHGYCEAWELNEENNKIPVKKRYEGEY